MSLTFSERYIAILNFLLVGVIVYFLAQSVSAAVRLHLAGVQMPEVPVHGPVSRPAVGLRPRNYYNAIVQRDIFSLVPAQEAAPVENENLNLTLIGTSQVSSGKPFIIVENSDGDQSLYRLGETIPNVGRVLSIGRTRAVILHNGHRVVIEIPNEGGDQGPPPFTPYGIRRRPFMFNPMIRPGANGGVRRQGENRYVVARAEVNQSLENMGSLFTQIRAIPNMQGGSPNGFRLSEIQSGSIFDQIGLQDGDVVTAAQGQSVSDPMKAMELLSSLRNSSSITLNVIRDGSPMQLFYSIR
jgi:general secretion pathway protein C